MSNDLKCPNCHDDYNYYDNIHHIVDLVQKAEVTQVTIGEDAMLYVYVPKEISYTQKEQCNMRDRIVEAFSKVYPDTPVFMGFVRMEFSEIEDKAAFKGKLAGTIL